MHSLGVIPVLHPNSVSNCRSFLCLYRYTCTDMPPDRTFSSWSKDCPNPSTDPTSLMRDIGNLDDAINSTLKKLSNSNGKFDPNIVTTKCLTSLDNTQNSTLIADMAGLLYYRALPLCRTTKQGLAAAEDSQGCYQDAMADLSLMTDEMARYRDLYSSVNEQLSKHDGQLLKRNEQVIELQSEISSLKDSIISMKDAMLEKSVTAVQNVVKDEIMNYSAVLQTAATAVNETLMPSLPAR